MSLYTKQEVILRIQDVNLALGGRQILKSVGAELHNITRPNMNQGQVTCLLGPSGVGKTQLFNVLAGLSKPDSGQVLINGDSEPVKAGMVGVVSQHYTLFRHRTIMGNLLVAAKRKSADESTSRTLAREYLKRFGLGDKEHAYPAELSGGQRQRVAIIQQLLSSDHFILMDEPFSGLDPIAKQTVFELIQEVTTCHELNTMIITTHDIEAAVTIADSIWLLGRDRDTSGHPIGARIQKQYDLAAMGLAWTPDIQSSPEFFELVKQIKAEFKTL